MIQRMVFRIFLASIIVLFAVTSFSNAEMVGAWMFEGNSEEIVKDVSEHGNDGNILGGAERVEGKYGGGLKFDGTDDYVDLGVDPSLNPPLGISIVAWIFVESTANWNMIVVKWGAGVQSYHFALKNGLLSMYVNGKQNFSVDDTEPVPTGEWVHVATTADSVTKDLKIYLNGSEVGSVKYDGSLAETPNPPGIGAKISAEGAAGQLLFSGIMDEVAIFDEALTPDHIEKIMEGLETFMPVDPKGSLTTSWGNVKRNASCIY